MSVWVLVCIGGALLSFVIFQICREELFRAPRRRREDKINRVFRRIAGD
jgi:hypothetical protein